MSLHHSNTAWGVGYDATTHYTPTRSQKLRAALEYAEKEKPVFPCRQDKRPAIPKCPEAKELGLVGEELARHARTCSRGGHGFHDATTDERRITAYWNAHRGANIGMPAGELSDVWVLDIDVDPEKEVDGRPALAELEREHGKLPETLSVCTPRGGTHLYFQHPGWYVKSRTDQGAIAPGLEVKGDGGYVLLPPSTTERGSYVVERHVEVAEAPEWLLELVREKRPPVRKQRRRGRVEAATGETIPEGQRNRTLFFAALDMKDRGETPAEVLGHLLAINEARCSPALDAGEVERIAKSAMRYPIRSGTPSPEILEAVEQLEGFWWQHPWQGMGGKTDRDVYRVLIELARRYGTLLEDGSVAVSASVRSVALAAATRYETVSGRVTPRLAQAGLIRKTGSGRKSDEHAATWVLLPQASLLVNTQQSSTYVEEQGGVYDPLRSRLWDLSTPVFRWTGHVKKGRAGVLYVLEAFGPMRLKELAERMGWGNHRELKRRYLEDTEREDGSIRQGLLSMGLVEERDGLLSLVADHEERVEEIRRAPYTTVHRRKRESREGGRLVRWVEETETTASEVEREEKERRDHEKQRERYRESRSPEAEEEYRLLLNAWDEERWTADGEISEIERIEPSDEQEVHPLACECLECSARVPSYARAVGR